jgi:UDP-GlcNAc:undecaprenyl-phosphate GlcNAc-1-phosphate transferase
MIAIVAIFVVSLLACLLLTPLVEGWARRLKVVDHPSIRKIHSQETPRGGGVAIYLSFLIASLTTMALFPDALSAFLSERHIAALIVGASLAFGLGLWDDLRRLKAPVKLAVQVAAALVAYYGGIQIENVTVPGSMGLHLGWLSLPVTVFWFLLIINAMNLIDGLDGLAAGIAFFASLVLMILCLTGQKPLIALGLAALAGANLGFLRYNFNPASIFMGDSGSYFLGFMLAALSVLGPIKSQAAAAILIPIIALGLPIVDVIFAPLRRFFFGHGPFEPDRDHLHHRLIRLGCNQRTAVFVLYGITVCMGALSLIMVHTNDKEASLLLMAIGAAAVLGIRKLGYLEYLALDKVFGWFKDITDAFGLHRERRTFLGWQMTIYESKQLHELWERIVGAAHFLGLDYLELMVFERYGESPNHQVCLWEFGEGEEEDAWDAEGKHVMRLSLPLANSEHQLGLLVVAKDLGVSPLSPYTLRRIEQLRRTVMETLLKMADHKLAHFPKFDEDLIALFPRFCPPDRMAAAADVAADVTVAAMSR